MPAEPGRRRAAIVSGDGLPRHGQSSPWAVVSWLTRVASTSGSFTMCSGALRHAPHTLHVRRLWPVSVQP